MNPNSPSYKLILDKYVRLVKLKLLFGYLSHKGLNMCSSYFQLDSVVYKIVK